MGTITVNIAVTTSRTTYRPSVSTIATLVGTCQPVFDLHV